MTGLTTTGLWQDGDNLVERRTQDVEPVIEQVKDLRSLGLVGSNEMHHVARLPVAVIENYIARAGITMHEFMCNPVHIKAMCNDPELSAFRIRLGRV